MDYIFTLVPYCSVGHITPIDAQDWLNLASEEIDSHSEAGNGLHADIVRAHIAWDLHDPTKEKSENAKKIFDMLKRDAPKVATVTVQRHFLIEALLGLDSLHNDSITIGIVPGEPTAPLYLQVGDETRTAMIMPYAEKHEIRSEK